MSEQNPPGQPTPAEGVGPTAHEEATQPAPSSGRSTSPWIIGTAVLLVILLVAGGTIAALTVFKKDSHKIATPATAAGMKRDSKQEAALKQQLDTAETEFKTQFQDVTYVRSAVYNQSDKDKGPQGAIVFLGAKVKKSENNASRFVDNLRKQATTNGFKVTTVKAGDNGGKAVCAEQSGGQKVTICGWATKDSGGEVLPIVPGWDADKLSAVMRDLRKDVEKSE